MTVVSHQCTATSSRSGEQCRRRASLGAAVCVMHGAGAPQVKAAAARRLALAEAMTEYERRSPLEILADTLHAADVLLRQAIEAAEAGVTMTPEDLASVVKHLERAETFARATIGLGIAERQVALAERSGELLNRGLDWLLGSLSLDQEARQRAEALVVTLLRSLAAGEVPALPAGGD